MTLFLRTLPASSASINAFPLASVATCFIIGDLPGDGPLGKFLPPLVADVGDIDLAELASAES